MGRAFLGSRSTANPQATVSRQLPNRSKQMPKRPFQSSSPSERISAFRMRNLPTWQKVISLENLPQQTRGGSAPPKRLMARLLNPSEGIKPFRARAPTQKQLMRRMQWQQQPSQQQMTLRNRNAAMTLIEALVFKSGSGVAGRIIRALMLSASAIADAANQTWTEAVRYD